MQFLLVQHFISKDYAILNLILFLLLNTDHLNYHNNQLLLF